MKTFSYGLNRLILASTRPNARILDPFTGSSPTGISANLANRRFLGIDKVEEYLTISKNRKLEIENCQKAAQYRKRMEGFIHEHQFSELLETEMSKTF